jgi:hypothetical protein
MTKPDDEHSAQSDSYINWLEACDQAIAHGRSPLDSLPPPELLAAENETLDVLRRLDRLRASAIPDRPTVFDVSADDATTRDGGPLPPGGDWIKTPCDFGDYELLEPIAQGAWGSSFEPVRPA